MNSETAKKLEAILNDRQRREEAAIAQASEQEKAEGKNLADFAAKKLEVIRPAFQEIVDLYKARGVTIRMVEENERPNNRGGVQSASIRLDMAGFYSSRSDLSPRFELRFENRNRKLSLYTSTPTQGGPAGDVSLDAITEDWINDAFLKYQTPASR